jgi:predicted O-methyltransferase YrrM
MPKTITTVTDSLYEYMLNTWLREPDVLKALRKETAQLEMSAMQISPDQGQFMAFLVRLMNAKRILEVGTFTGYSALAMALATAEDATIVCCDVSVKWTDIGKKYWQQAEVENKIDLRIAPALETLNDLMAKGKSEFDFAFIDADKTNYDAYYEACYSLIKPNGVIAIDNVFWGGWVGDTAQQDDDTKAIRALNKKLQNDNRVDLSIVPIGDGLTLARKRR